MTLKTDIIKAVVAHFPLVRHYLKEPARAIADALVPELKTVAYMAKTIRRLIKNFYDDYISRNDFLDLMFAVIRGQLRQAYITGAKEAGLDEDELTPEMQDEMLQFVLDELPFVDLLAQDILNARTLDRAENTPGKRLDKIIWRADLWANRYNEVVSAARLRVTELFGGKMVWVLGATEKHCETCSALNGKVAFAREWRESGLAPQGSMLMCGGRRCDCELIPTDRRRSPRVMDYLMSVPRK
jgi:hypothetical protein